MSSNRGHLLLQSHTFSCKATLPDSATPWPKHIQTITVSYYVSKLASYSLSSHHWPQIHELLQHSWVLGLQCNSPDRILSCASHAVQVQCGEGSENKAGVKEARDAEDLVLSVEVQTEKGQTRNS